MRSIHQCKESHNHSRRVVLRMQNCIPHILIHVVKIQTIRHCLTGYDYPCFDFSQGNVRVERSGTWNVVYTRITHGLDFDCLQWNQRVIREVIRSHDARVSLFGFPSLFLANIILSKNSYLQWMRTRVQGESWIAKRNMVGTNDSTPLDQGSLENVCLCNTIYEIDDGVDSKISMAFCGNVFLL